MGSPIRSGYPNKDRKTQRGSIRERGGIYHRVSRVSAYLHLPIRCEFLSPAIVIFNTPNRGSNRRAGKAFRDVDRDRK